MDQGSTSAATPGSCGPCPPARRISIAGGDDGFAVGLGGCQAAIVTRAPAPTSSSSARASVIAASARASACASRFSSDWPDRSPAAFARAARDRRGVHRAGVALPDADRSRPTRPARSIRPTHARPIPATRPIQVPSRPFPLGEKPASPSSRRSRPARARRHALRPQPRSRYPTATASPGTATSRSSRPSRAASLTRVTAPVTFVSATEAPGSRAALVVAGTIILADRLSDGTAGEPISETSESLVIIRQDG